MRENPAFHPPALSPNESTMKRRYKDYDSKLSEIISLPKITGTAVVVAFGNEIACIRSIGDAPPIGSRGQRGVGLTGICLSTGKVELCNDVEHDSRADLQACADLGVRSVLVVPIWHGSRVAGVLEALSSKPNAFDWRNIRHIRRIAHAFDPFTLESWVVPSPEPQDRLEQAASLSVEGQINKSERQKPLSAASLVQNRAGAAATASAHEDRGKKHGFEALRPVKELPTQRCINPPHSEAPGDAAARFLRSEGEFLGEGRPRYFVGSVILLVILLVCFFEFRTHLTWLSALLDVQPRLARASSPSSTAASPKGLRKELEPAFASHLLVKKSAPNRGTAMPQSSAAAVAKFDKPEQYDDAEANWQQAFAYLKGVGVQQDEGQAAKWLKKAANQGDPRAQAALSDLYLKGIGVQRDYVRAYTWATIAAGQVAGEDQRLAFLQQRMTRSELADANRRIQTWFHAQRGSR
jgi:hypothetical protein